MAVTIYWLWFLKPIGVIKLHEEIVITSNFSIMYSKSTKKCLLLSSIIFLFLKYMLHLIKSKILL